MCSVPGLPIPGTEIPVFITRVNLIPSCGLVELWVNMNDERKHIYEQMREEIQTSQRKFSGSEGKPGDLCLVCISDTWHRARIVSIQSETYSLFLIDQGKPHTATSEVLAWAQSDSFLLPPEIEWCILSSVLPLENNWPDRATKFLMSLTGKKFEGLVQHVLMPDRTILLEIPFVSKHMCKCGVAKKIPVEEFKDLVLKCLHLPKHKPLEAFHKVKEQSLNVSGQLAKRSQYFYPELLTDTLETVTVTEVIDPENTFCKLLIFSKAVNVLSKQIHQHYKESSACGEAQPQTCGDPCAARGADGRWHRSLLKQNIETCDGVVEVLHVDDGKSELVPVEDIRLLLGTFLRMPVVTYLCSLNGIKENIKEWTAEHTDHLKSLLLNQTMVARFDHYDKTQDVYYVTLYAANASCINTCFLEKAGLFPPVKSEQDLIVRNEPVPSSCLSLHRDKQCIELQDKVYVNGVPEETAPSSKNQVVSGGYESKSGTSDIVKESFEHLDPVIHCNGHLATGLASEMQSAYDDNLFTVGSSVNVKVSCIESLQKFWCQAMENEDSLRCLMRDLQNHYASIHPQPLVDFICVARNPDNGMWYRAKIITSSHLPVVDVRFVDYGQTKKVPLRDVRPIDPAFLRLSAQAFQCCLFNLKSPTHPTATAWNNDALTEFHKFVDLNASSNTGLKCVVKDFASDEEGLPLNMVDIEAASDSVCELLAQKCAQSEVHVQFLPQATLDVYDYSTYNIEVGSKESVWVTFSVTVNHFYCQLDRNSNLFYQVKENITELLGQPRCSDQPLKLNSLCIARYSCDEWCRGQVVEMSPKLKVHFVDYGDTLAVNETDIYPFPNERSIARSVPVLAVPLGLFNVPAEIPQEVNQWFADHAVGHSFTISVVAKGEKGKLRVELYDGSLSVNMKVREKMVKMKQEKMAGVIQQADCHHSNNSTKGYLAQELLEESVLTKIVGQNGVDSSDSDSAEDLKRSSKLTTNVSALEIGYLPVSHEGRKSMLPIIFEEEIIVAETSIQVCHSDSETTQPSPCPEEDLTILMYKWPNISQQQFEEVYASCIVGPDYFWCQYTNTEDLNIITEVAQETGQAKDVICPEVLVPGSPCLALFSSDNQWYRAQVIQKADDMLNVLFIDYGNESEVDIKNVRSLPQSLLEIAPQAFLCILNGFDESKGSWDDKVYEDFYSCVVDKPLKVAVFNMENHSEIAVPQYRVNIECDEMFINNLLLKYWKSFSAENFNNEMAQTKTFPPGIQTEGNTSHFEISKGRVNTYKKPGLSINESKVVYASWVRGPHFFWCQYANTEDLCTVSQLAQEAGQAQQDMTFPETLGPGSPCLALFSSDNQWYRAQVFQKTDSTLRVLFIDYGNESEVDIRTVKSLSQTLLEKAPQAFLCCLNGFKKSEGSWDDAAYDDFYNLVIDKLLKLTVISIGGHLEITLPQYNVEIECDGVSVNTLMQKYWNPVTEECVTTDSAQTEDLLQGVKMESKITQVCVSKGRVHICMYKEPGVSINEPEMVYASCIEDPLYFWCQYANTEDLCTVSQLAQETGQAQQDMTFPETLGPGSPCLALFSSDNQWHRAQVIQKTDSTVHVLFIDYGNESEVDIRNVKSLSQTLLEKAPQAFLCCLNGFKESEGSWDDAAYDDFYNLVIDKPLKLTVISIGDHLEITLPQYNVEIECDGVSVNTLMQKYWNPFTKECVTTETEDLPQGGQMESNMIQDCVPKGRVHTCLYKKPRLSINKPEMVYASCVGGPHFFYCQYANTEDLCKVTQLAQEAGQAQQDMTFPEILGPGSPCLALFSSDNQWYRAQVIQKTESTLHVLFTDYGNESEVDIRNVRSLSQTLLEKAPQAFLCCLNGFKESEGSWDDAAYDDFYNLVIDKPLKLTVISIGDHLEITLPQYNVEIECEGMAVNTLMQKYWKETDNALAESLESANQDETRTKDERVRV